MREPRLKHTFKKFRRSSFNQLMLKYKKYLNHIKLTNNQKAIFNYNGITVGLTPKQIEVLKLIAKGFSNGKIAKKLLTKEATVKLLIYRLMKYLERMLYEENIDRFNLVIIAQKLDLDSSLDLVSMNGKEANGKEINCIDIHQG